VTWGDSLGTGDAGRLGGEIAKRIGQRQPLQLTARRGGTELATTFGLLIGSEHVLVGARLAWACHESTLQTP
jgi:hypothetical protein